MRGERETVRVSSTVAAHTPIPKREREREREEVFFSCLWDSWDPNDVA